jgi:hypothetical protein
MNVQDELGRPFELPGWEWEQAAVYVEKLNRIYIFGGWTLTNGG